METHSDHTEQAPANPALPVVVGLLMPWVLFLAAFTPRVYWPVSAVLLGVLAMLLLGGAAWSHREARRQDLDAARWATLAVLTLGASMLLLSSRAAKQELSLQALCHDCGRLCSWTEPFCYGCGAK